MDPQFRQLYNSAFSPEIYARYLGIMQGRLGCEMPFRLAETPVFLPSDLRERIELTTREILAQLYEPARTARMRAAVPPEYDVPSMDALPSFVQVDFAITRATDGTLMPRLIELQGLPSLTAFEVYQRDAWAEVMQPMPGLDRDWSPWFSGLTRDGFLDLARRTILGGHAPEEVVMLDIDPPTQKTWPDFVATRLLFGVEAVCLTDLLKRGRRLFRRCGDSEIPIRRIYNRVVFDELRQRAPALPFDYRDDLDVEWAPHPNWYWVWSKYSLPFLDHPAIPKARFLSDVDSLPADLTRNYVLKPLFSFAGGGVNVEPTASDVARIPDAERASWCLQEKIEYAPAITAADGGGVKLELRVMCLKPSDQAAHTPAQNLCRLSRGKMLGVDFNKTFSWVGSSVAIWPA